MGVFPSDNHPSNGMSKIIARRQTPPKAMRKILGGITHQSTSNAVSPERTKRVLFPLKERKQVREPSSSPNGGFFSHPAWKSAPTSTVNVRRRLHVSPSKASLMGGRGLKKRGIEDKLVKGKKPVKEHARGTRAPRLASSDDERAKVASSTAGHPSSDLGMLEETFHDADEEKERHFQQVVATLPPSSPPVFANDLDNASNAFSSPVNDLGNLPPSSPPIAPAVISRKRKAPGSPAPRQQKPKVSARTLEGRDDLPVIRVTYDGTYVLVLGRSRRALLEQGEGQVTNVEPVDTVLSGETAAHLVATGKSAKLAALPRTASHASRAHVLISSDTNDDAQEARITFAVLGQNGAKIRPLDGEATATRYPAGGVVQYARAPAAKFEVDMYSCRAIVEWIAPVVERVAMRGTTPTPMSPTVSPAREVDDALVELLQTPVVSKKSTPTIINKPTPAFTVLAPPAQEESPARSIHSQMTYESEPEHDAPEQTMPDLSREVKKEWLNAAQAATTDAQLVGRAPSTVSELLSAPTPSVPVDIDMKALVATSLVFSGSSAISAPDLVKAILDVSPPSLTAMTLRRPVSCSLSRV